jgi:hypothetical protein
MDKTIKTYEQWRGNFNKYVAVGDLVDEEIMLHFRDAVFPPTKFTDDMVQCGEIEAVAFDYKWGVAGDLYQTFTREGEFWRYCGICFEGETIPRENNDFANETEILRRWDLESLREYLDEEKEAFAEKWKNKETANDAYADGARRIESFNEYYNWRVEQEAQKGKPQTEVEGLNLMTCDLESLRAFAAKEREKFIEKWDGTERKSLQFPCEERYVSRFIDLYNRRVEEETPIGAEKPSRMIYDW